VHHGAPLQPARGLRTPAPGVRRATFMGPASANLHKTGSGGYGRVKKKPPEGGFDLMPVLADQAVIHTGFDLRRYAMKLTPAKPRIIIAHVEGSGTADVSCAISKFAPTAPAGLERLDQRRSPAPKNVEDRPVKKMESPTAAGTYPGFGKVGERSVGPL
jgi:hypothetical protein